MTVKMEGHNGGDGGGPRWSEEDGGGALTATHEEEKEEEAAGREEQEEGRRTKGILGAQAGSRLPVAEFGRKGEGCGDEMTIDECLTIPNVRAPF